MDYETQKRINDLSTELEKLRVLVDQGITDHRHTGFDMSRVMESDLDQRKLYIKHNLAGTSAATAGNYSTFWIAPFPCYVSAFYEVHATAGTDAGSVTLQLEKLTGTAAPGAGSAILSSALSLKATANTVQTGTITPTIANKNLVAEDRLALLLSGTPTNVANVTVLVELSVI